MTITKRKNKSGSYSYRIKVSLGYDHNGKQIVKSTTYVPPKGMPAKLAKIQNDSTIIYRLSKLCKAFYFLHFWRFRWLELATYFALTVAANYIRTGLKVGMYVESTENVDVLKLGGANV